MTIATVEPLDLDMLAVDIATTLERYRYDLDASEDEIRPALPAFIEAVRTNIAQREETGEDAATWTPADDESEDAPPVIQTGRRPRMTYLGWLRSQTVNMGATARDEHFWQCPKTGCKVWAGPYSDPMAAKTVGMDHVHYQHDLPAAKAARR